MVQELWDREHIAALPVTYARGVDRRDWDLVRSCFTPDCFIEGSRASASLDEYLTQLRPGVERFPTTMHFMGNQLVTVDGDRGHAVAFHWAGDPAGADDAANLVVGVRYQDSVVRTDDGWRIARRHVDPDWRVGLYP